MKAIINFGDKIRLEIDEREEMETLYKAIMFTQYPKVCNLCKNEEDFYFTTNKDKEGNIYVNIKCPKCEARAKLGQLKAGGYFWHEFEKYIPPTQSK